MKQENIKPNKANLKKIISAQIKLKKKDHPKEFSLARKFFRQVAQLDWLPDPYQSQLRALRPNRNSRPF